MPDDCRDRWHDALIGFNPYFCNMKELEDKLFSVRNAAEFEAVALEIFQFQFTHVPIYREFVSQLGKTKPQRLEEIPFLPIEFFKTHKVLADEYEAALEFKSSGTQGPRSTHFVARPDLYERSFNLGYDQLIGKPEEQVILALLPNYLEQGSSSLVYMVDHLIRRSGSELSGFFLNEHEALIERYRAAQKLGKKVVIFGVSYALLDLAELKPDLSEATIIETGGMKGRRKEETKSQLHDALRTGLNCPNISSEYGMTELLSQAYSQSKGVFTPSNTLKILIRDYNDPLSLVPEGKSGGINVIDLANLYSCSFIATQDLGRKSGDTFEILGRIDLADQRGCNLLVE